MAALATQKAEAERLATEAEKAAGTAGAKQQQTQAALAALRMKAMTEQAQMKKEQQVVYVY